MIEDIKQHTKLIRQPRFSRSKLDKHSDLIIQLHVAGATIAEIHRFLLQKRVAVSYSALRRWIKKNG